MIFVKNNVIILVMNVERLTVSLPSDSINFLSSYRKKHKLKSNSQIVLSALKLLEQEELRQEFTKAALEQIPEEAKEEKAFVDSNLLAFEKSWFADEKG